MLLQYVWEEKDEKQKNSEKVKSDLKKLENVVGPICLQRYIEKQMNTVLAAMNIWMLLTLKIRKH